MRSDDSFDIPASAPDATQSSETQRLRKRQSLRSAFWNVMDHGRGEWWAFGTFLAWLIVVPIALWISGQVGAGASLLKRFQALENTTPAIARTPLNATEMEETIRVIAAMYPNLTVSGSSAALMISSNNAEDYTDFIGAVQTVPSVLKGVQWQVLTLCLASSGTRCGGRAVSAELKGEHVRVELSTSESK